MKKSEVFGVSVKTMNACANEGFYTDPKYRQVPHRASSISHVLTVSMGVSTIIPAHDDDPINFVEQVDRLLYQAKQAGRNCSIDAEK
jgi:PleD family two-component response regulator